MHPVLLQLGPLTIRWYGVMMGLALFLAVPITTHFGDRFGIPRRLLTDSLAVPFLAALIIGARLGYVVSHPLEFAGDPVAAIVPPYAGLASHGSIAGVSVNRVVDFERRSITNRFELPPCCRLMMTRWPSGENRGANDMPGKLPTISRCPVSMLNR